MTYNKRLKYLRIKNNWTMKDVSNKTGIELPTYGGYESGHRKPPIDVLAKLSLTYGVSSDYILGLTDEEDPIKIEYNISEYLKKDNLNWNGTPISYEELKPIREIIKLIIKNKS